MLQKQIGLHIQLGKLLQPRVVLGFELDPSVPIEGEGICEEKFDSLLILMTSFCNAAVGDFK